jgi:hypothetical protein
MHHHHFNPFAAFLFGFAANHVLNQNKNHGNQHIHVSTARHNEIKNEKETPLHSNRKTQADDIIAALENAYLRIQNKIDEKNKFAREYNLSKEKSKRGTDFFYTEYPKLPPIDLPSKSQLIAMLDNEEVGTVYELRKFIEELERKTLKNMANPLQYINFSLPCAAEIIWKRLQGVKGFGTNADCYDEKIKEINKERKRRNLHRGFIAKIRGEDERMIPRLKLKMLSEKEILNIVVMRNPRTWEEFYKLQDEITAKVYNQYYSDPDFKNFSS